VKQKHTQEAVHTQQAFVAVFAVCYIADIVGIT